jgi:hypothetical protein
VCLAAEAGLASTSIIMPFLVRRIPSWAEPLSAGGGVRLHESPCKIEPVLLGVALVVAAIVSWRSGAHESVSS